MLPNGKFHMFLQVLCHGYCTVSTPHSHSLFCWGRQPSVPRFEIGGGDQEENECLGGLKESLPQIFAWELVMLLVKKDFVK